MDSYSEGKSVVKLGAQATKITAASRAIERVFGEDGDVWTPVGVTVSKAPSQ